MNVNLIDESKKIESPKLRTSSSTLSYNSYQSINLVLIFFSLFFWLDETMSSFSLSFDSLFWISEQYKKSMASSRENF